MGKLKLNKKVFLKALQEQKRSEKINITEVARKMKVDRSYIYRVMRGNAAPGRKFIEGALEVCKGYSFDELFFLAQPGKTITERQEVL